MHICDQLHHCPSITESSWYIKLPNPTAPSHVKPGAAKSVFWNQASVTGKILKHFSNTALINTLLPFLFRGVSKVTHDADFENSNEKAPVSLGTDSSERKDCSARPDLRLFRPLGSAKLGWRSQKNGLP